MADDIVTRLRNGPDCAGWSCDFSSEHELIAAAADEIERLREWKAVADLFGAEFRMDEWGQYPPDNGGVHQAALAYERLKTEEARRG